MTPESLPRTQRMRRRAEFERAYTTGVRVHGRLLTLFVVPNGRDVSRLGVAATRKLGAAVERNRAKRLARELFRRHKVTSGLDIVIVPRRELLDAPFATVEDDYLGALARRSTARPADRSRGRTRGARPAPRV
jgi:ribonuclease P protein component